MSKLAFLFPGQGAQTVGMGRQAFEEYPAVKSLFERANDVLGFDLGDVCFNGPEDKLNATDVCQPALYVTSMAAVEMLRQTDPASVESCTAAAGLSLGEYSALAFADVLTFEDGLKLVHKRGQAMQAAADRVAGSMVSVLGLPREQVESICDEARADGEVLQVANLLCPGNIAVSGHQASCDAVAAAAEVAARKSRRLRGLVMRSPVLKDFVASLSYSDSTESENSTSKKANARISPLVE